MASVAAVARRASPGIQLAAALAFVTALVVLLCRLFEPRWETNDDIAMSMVAHGYGIAASGTPKLIISSVVWGYLVRLIPSIDGIYGYATATMGTLVAVGTAILYGACRIGVGGLTAVALVILVLMRAILFPQFTVNAGLLMVGAVVCAHLYARDADLRALAAGCFLAFCSFLVRELEFLLILAVALPLLPWRTLVGRRAAQLGAAAIVLALAAAAFIDHQAYQGPEWRSFNELNPARAPFTDFGAGERLKQRPDILERHGYSANDVDLVRQWFFVDPRIANPRVLTEMSAELGAIHTGTAGYAQAWLGVQTLWHPRLLPLVFAALALALLRPSWRLAASWTITIAAVVMLGILGRPGILRVYVPVACLLLLAPFLSGTFSGWRRRIATAVVVAAAAINTHAVAVESREAQASDEAIHRDMAAFPADPVVVWGSAFPFEAVYPVIGAPRLPESQKLLGLGVFTLAPFSAVLEEDEAGRGMIARLLEENGVPIVSNDERLGYLEIYCREHHNGQLEELSALRGERIVVRWLRCKVNPA